MLHEVKEARGAGAQSVLQGQQERLQELQQAACDDAEEARLVVEERMKSAGARGVARRAAGRRAVQAAKRSRHALAAHNCSLWGMAAAAATLQPARPRAHLAPRPPARCRDGPEGLACQRGGQVGAGAVAAGGPAGERPGAFGQRLLPALGQLPRV